MADEKILKIFEQGAAEFNKFRAKNPNLDLDLTDINIRDMDLSQYRLFRIDFGDAVFEGCHLGKFENCKFSKVTFRRCASQGFTFCKMEVAYFVECSLAKIHVGLKSQLLDFSKCVLRDVRFVEGGSSYVRMEFSESSIGDVTMGDMELGTILFDNCELRNATFRKLSLGGLYVNGSEIGHSKFEDCVIANATFKPKRFYGDIDFSNSLLDGAAFDKKWAKILLQSNSISMLQYSSLKIDDSTKDLKSMFIGIQQWAHAVSFACFLVPYLLLITKLLILKLWVGESTASVSLLWAVSCFVWTGGGSLTAFSRWPDLSCGLFAYLLVLNSVRVYLFLNFKRIEGEEQLNEISSEISTDSYLKWTTKAYFWFAFIGYFLVVIHSIRFLSIEVPVDLTVGF